MSGTDTLSLHDVEGEVDSYLVRGGIIVSPGKFEGQMCYMPAAYEAYLNGFCDDNGRTVRVDVPGEFADYAEMRRRRTVAFVVTDQGFVEEVAP